MSKLNLFNALKQVFVNFTVSELAYKVNQIVEYNHPICCKAPDVISTYGCLQIF